MDAGFANSVSCAPSVCEIIKASTVQLLTNSDMEELFFESLERCFVEMHKKGSTSEEFCSESGFPVDQDCKGNIQHLSANSLVHEKSSKFTTHHCP